MSEPNTWHPRLRPAPRARYTRFAEIRLCRRLAPDMAYISPFTYSCLTGLFSSRSRYSAGLRGADFGCMRHTPGIPGDYRTRVGLRQAGSKSVHSRMVAPWPRRETV